MPFPEGTRVKYKMSGLTGTVGEPINPDHKSRPQNYDATYMVYDNPIEMPETVEYDDWGEPHGMIPREVPAQTIRGAWFYTDSLEVIQ